MCRFKLSPEYFQFSHKTLCNNARPRRPEAETVSIKKHWRPPPEAHAVQRTEHTLADVDSSCAGIEQTLNETENRDDKLKRRRIGVLVVTIVIDK